MTQNVFVMSEYQDSTNILGPFNARTLLYMLEDGQIDRNTSLIKQGGSTASALKIPGKIAALTRNPTRPAKTNEDQARPGMVDGRQGRRRGPGGSGWR